ncbi:MAG: SpoIIE family protein phosphatase [Terriglobales bacterium]
MAKTSTTAVGRVQWAMAQLPQEGETQIGDAALVLEMPHGCLLAVADGLGHGREAAEAAQTAMQVLRQRAVMDTATQLLQACHEALRTTRGAVMSLAWIDYAASTLTWLGVGNVSAMLLRAGAPGDGTREFLLCRAGMLGAQLPPLYAASTSIAAGDVLLFHTDGVDSERASRFNEPLMPPERAATQLLRDGARRSDDALVLVARYEGPPREPLPSRSDREPR